MIGAGALHTVAAVFHAAPEVAAADDNADLHAVITDAVGQYVSDVKSADYPRIEESY